jgi:hypothetical protein
MDGFVRLLFLYKSILSGIEYLSKYNKTYTREFRTGGGSSFRLFGFRTITLQNHNNRTKLRENRHVIYVMNLLKSLGTEASHATRIIRISSYYH